MVAKIPFYDVGTSAPGVVVASDAKLNVLQRERMRQTAAVGKSTRESRYLVGPLIEEPALVITIAISKQREWRNTFPLALINRACKGQKN